LVGENGISRFKLVVGLVRAEVNRLRGRVEKKGRDNTNGCESRSFRPEGRIEKSKKTIQTNRNEKAILSIAKRRYHSGGRRGQGLFQQQSFEREDGLENKPSFGGQHSICEIEAHNRATSKQGREERVGDCIYQPR
jgi:hypothetical protein